MNGLGKWRVEQEAGNWCVVIPTGDGKYDRVKCRSEFDARNLAAVPEVQDRFHSASDVTEETQVESLRDDLKLLKSYGLDNSGFARWLENLIRDAEKEFD